MRLRPRLPIATAVLLLLCASCRTPPPAPTIDTFAQRYIALALALGDRDPDSLDFYIGPPSATATARQQRLPTSTIAQQAATLRDDIAHAPNPQGRAGFLIHQLDAIQLRAEMLGGKTLPTDQEGAILFGVTVPADTQAPARAQARSELAHQLNSGTKNLAQHYSDFGRAFVVPPAKVPAVMDAALQACKAATLDHLQLPANEHIDVEYVRLKPWSGFSRYLGHAHSLIQINMDFPLTVDQLLALACHEGYPGHHVFNTLREQALVDHASEREWQVQPTFSPQSFVSEAAASYAVDVAMPPAHRLHVERDILFPIAGIAPGRAAEYLAVERLAASLSSAESSIARDYLDGRLEYARAGEALERQLLMQHADALLLYLNEYRSYMLTYTVGRSAVERLIENSTATGTPTELERWRRYTLLMQSPIYSFDNQP